MSPAWPKWLSPKPAATSAHVLVADPCVRGSQQHLCCCHKQQQEFFPNQVFHIVSNLVNLIQTCTWQGQTQYTDVIKTILSSVCKRNPFFAVSCPTVNVYEAHSQLLLPCWALALPAGTGTHRTSATNHGWGREPWKHPETSHHRLWNNHKPWQLGELSQQENFTA